MASPGAGRPPRHPDLDRLERERRVAGDVDAGRPVAPGTLTPRRRVDRLVDPGSLVELGALAASQQPAAAGPTPGDGLLTGFATVGGHPVAVISEDPLVLARTDGQVAKSKRRRILKLALQKLALQQDVPVVLLVDGPGRDLPSFPAGAGALFGGLAEQQEDADLRRRRAILIGVVLGAAAGQTAELLAEADVVVRRAGTGADPGVVADVEADDDLRAAGVAAAVLALAAGGDPGSPGVAPAPGGPGWPDGAPAPGALEGVPEAAAIAGRLADAGTWVPFVRDPGSGLVTGVLRLGGAPAVIGVTGACGIRELVATDIHRLRRAVALSERMEAPLVLVQDCDGYSPDVMDKPHAAASLVDLVAALRSLSPPFVSLVAGAGHVLGTFCLGGRQLGPSCVLAWPWARIGVVDTPGYEVASLGPHRQAGPWLAAGMGLVDDVLTPEETAPWLRWFVKLSFDRGRAAPRQPGERWYARSSIKGT
jgi:acetyl-CoA carboxylase carboxyltransferase component